jgi:EAL domain-containing protein (putative c-di-GMP-specific phosphodiesterase class I)
VAVCRRDAAGAARASRHKDTQMSNNDGLFDLKEIEAITCELRMLCHELAERLHASDPSAALEFAENLKSRKISAETFVELFRENIIERLNPPAKIRTVLIESTMRKTH